MLKNDQMDVSHEISAELQQIYNNNNGMLDPRKVVDFAKDPTTALHSRFEWDDSIAAEKYRLAQARQIIRLEVVIIKQKQQGTIELAVDNQRSDNDGVKARKWVSLEPDRFGVEDKGYRKLSEVLKKPILRAQLLYQAKKDMEIFMQKYAILEELDGVIDAMNIILTDE